MRKSVDNVNNKGKPSPKDRGVDNADGPGSVIELVHLVMHRFRSGQHRALDEQAAVPTEPANTGEQHTGVTASAAKPAAVVAPPETVTHMESKVLGFFGRHPGATQTDLVQHSGRDKAQLARLIKGLRERGLLAAEADAADRRNVHLRLTPAGEAVQGRLRSLSRLLETQALQGLTTGERQQLLALLTRVERNLSASAEPPAR